MSSLWKTQKAGNTDLRYRCLDGFTVTYLDETNLPRHLTLLSGIPPDLHCTKIL
jgi:hypothetical protein